MNDGMESRFRNLLVTLARDAEELKESVRKMHAELKNELDSCRVTGLRSKIKERNRTRSRLLYLLGRNSRALRHFFGTTDPQLISCEQILFASSKYE